MILQFLRSVNAIGDPTLDQAARAVQVLRPGETYAERVARLNRAHAGSRCLE